MKEVNEGREEGRVKEVDEGRKWMKEGRKEGEVKEVNEGRKEGSG